MKVAFYKGTGKLFDRITRWWTQGPFSHCELVLTESGFSASSSFRDGGVRFKQIDYTEHPERWEFVSLAYLPEPSVSQAWLYFDEHKDEEYDVFGLAGFMFRFYQGSRTKKFCSEAVAESLGIKEGWRFDPNTLYTLLRFLERTHNASK